MRDGVAKSAGSSGSSSSPSESLLTFPWNFFRKEKPTSTSPPNLGLALTTATLCFNWTMRYGPNHCEPSLFTGHCGKRFLWISTKSPTEWVASILPLFERRNLRERSAINLWLAIRHSSACSRTQLSTLGLASGSGGDSGVHVGLPKNNSCGVQPICGLS